VKKAKIKNTKKVESKKNIQQTQENFSGRTALITICTIVVVFVSFYFLTDYLVSKRTVNKENTNSNTNLNTKNITFQDLLKKSEKEYYVFALMDDKDEDYYTLQVGLTGKTYYKIDMKDTMNKSYISKETIVKDSIRDIRISDTTLFVIKEGKISEHFVGKEKITEYLKKNYKKESSKS